MFSNERSPAEQRSCNPSKTSSTEIDRGRCKIRSDTHGPSQRTSRISHLTRCAAAPRNLCRAQPRNTARIVDRPLITLNQWFVDGPLRTPTEATAHERVDATRDRSNRLLESLQPV